MRASTLFLAIASVYTASAAMANAQLKVNTSVDYNDVKYHIDQCVKSGGAFSIAGWYISGEDKSPGNLKVYLDENGISKEVPITRRERSDVSDELMLAQKTMAGFSGTLNLPKKNQSFDADIKLVEIYHGKPREINYSCNSLR